jgi:hypothetical protein
MSQQSYYTDLLHVTDDSDVISNYSIFYERRSDYGRISQTFERELSKWHTKKYKENPKYSTADPNSPNDTIIKYITQFVTFIVMVGPDPFVLDSDMIQGEVDGVTVKILLKKMKTLTEYNTDYSELLNLTKRINEIIMNDNKYLNDLIYEERQELSNVEYAMDNC